MKLYSQLGYNEDGTMTQKGITDAIEEISLRVDYDKPHTVYLHKPWVSTDEI